MAAIGREVVAHLFEKGEDVNARNKVKTDMYFGSMYRLALLCVIPLYFTFHPI